MGLCYLEAGVADLLSLAAGLLELLVVADVPLLDFLCRFTGFLESVPDWAGVEVEDFVAGAGVAGAGVFWAASKLTAASMVRIRGFIGSSPSGFSW